MKQIHENEDPFGADLSNTDKPTLEQNIQMWVDITSYARVINRRLLILRRRLSDACKRYGIDLGFRWNPKPNEITLGPQLFWKAPPEVVSIRVRRETPGVSLALTPLTFSSSITVENRKEVAPLTQQILALLADYEEAAKIASKVDGRIRRQETQRQKDSMSSSSNTSLQRHVPATPPETFGKKFKNPYTTQFRHINTTVVNRYMGPIENAQIRGKERAIVVALREELMKYGLDIDVVYLADLETKYRGVGGEKVAKTQSLVVTAAGGNIIYANNAPVIGVGGEYLGTNLGNSLIKFETKKWMKINSATTITSTVVSDWIKKAAELFKNGIYGDRG